MHTNDVLNHRRRPRASGSRNDGGDGGGDGSSGKDEDGSKDRALQRLATDAQSGHTIHHRPAAMSKIDTSLFSKDVLASVKDFAAVLPSLLKHLQCPTCSDFLQDPTTLICGHSLCLMCTVPPDTDAVVYASSVPLPSDPLVASPPPEQGSEQLASSSSKDAIASAKKHVTVIHTDTFCPLPACRRLTKAKAKGRNGLHIDYALHKVASAVAEFLASSGMSSSGTDDEDHRQHPSQSGSIQELGIDNGNEADDDNARPRSESVDAVSSSPGSSPEQTPNTEDGVMKRNMGGRRDGWMMSKRKKLAKRGLPAPEYRPSPALLSLVNNVASELECQVCVTLLLDPLTTPCGHTFCKKCLFHSLDHSSRCPLCRSELPGFETFVTAPINHTVSNLIADTFPTLHAERKQNEEDLKDNALDTPIFVCMVSFPHMPTNLHIYEPRYRLMMRRAMDHGNRRFGMVLPSRTNGGFSQYGTMLEITNMTMFDDGRSVVESVGLYRFKILESGLLDGYTVARTERIEDIDDEQEAEFERAALARSEAMSRSASKQSANGAHPTGLVGTPGPTTPGGGPGVGYPTAPLMSATSSNASNAQMPPPRPPPSHAGGPAPFDPNSDAPSDAPEVSTEQLIAKCREFVEALRTGSTPWLLQRLNSSLPPMPEDPRKFTWWMAMLMPIDDHEKAKLLQITSYRLRLRLLVFWIQQMQHSWWFNRGCAIA